MAKLKNGAIAAEVEREKTLWTDKKRILGMPISFTRYTLTDNRLLVNSGLFSLREDEVKLYRVRDVVMTQSLGERLFGVGTVTVVSSDATSPELPLLHIKNPRDVKEVLTHQVEERRTRNRIRTTELMDGSSACGGDEEGFDADPE